MVTLNNHIIKPCELLKYQHTTKNPQHSFSLFFQGDSRGVIDMLA